MQDEKVVVGLRRDALADQVYELLRSRIINCELAPATRLNMDALARELQVSQTPIREAVNRLASERLVNVEAYRAVVVAALLSDAQLEQLMQARLVIELGSLRTDAPRDPARGPSQTGLDALSNLVAEMDALVTGAKLDIRRFNEADARFHRLLVAAGGNEFLLQAYDDLKAHVLIARHFQGRSISEARQANEEHRRMLAACEEGDVEALAAETEQHVRRVLHRLAGTEAGTEVGTEVGTGAGTEERTDERTEEREEGGQ